MRFASKTRAYAAYTLAGAALAFIVVAWAGRLGEWSNVADAANLFLPYSILLGLGSVGGALLLSGRMRTRGRLRIVAVAIILLVASGFPLVAREFDSASSGPDCGHSLELIQLNAWKDNPDTPSVARWIRARRPDIVVLEESVNRIPLTPLLADAYPYRQTCDGTPWCSTVILSQIRPMASGGLAHGDPENRGALSAAWMAFGTPAATFTLVGAHLGRPWPFPRYQEDRPELARFVSTRDPATTIVAGDFNLPGWTYQMAALERQFGLQRITRALLTWPAILSTRHGVPAMLGLDQIFIGSRWHADSVVRGPFVGSDHYPVVARLSLCGGIADKR
jgi:endonuclease/exonuclease/phosphatase (EEP) superfamily protein YafD